MAKPNKSFKLPRPLTKTQELLMDALTTREMVLTIGPAGTGKSFIPAAYAAYYYHINRVEKIVLIRPTVPVGKGIGFLPGTLEEKLEPWMQPFIAVLERFLSKGEVDCMRKNGKLEVVPFDVIRGRTFDDAFIILDEGQNTTIAEMKAFVTRIGHNSITVINGDEEQSDLKTQEDNGLSYLVDLLGDIFNDELASKVALVEFDWEDCVRSPLCKLWLKAFKNGT